MQVTTIGDIEVSRLGLGTSRMASLGTGRSRRDAARLLDAAADLGVTLIDTADSYGSTACERWLGEVMPRRAQHFVLATKCGLARASLPGPLRAFNQPVKKVLQHAGPRHYLRPDYVRRSIEASLRRLRRERIEIYFLHSPPAGIEERDDLFRVLDDARAAGKIGVYGVSTPDPGVICKVARVRHCMIAQTTVNPLAASRLPSEFTAPGGLSSVELIANHVLIGSSLLFGVPGNCAPAVASLARRLDAISAEQGLSRPHLLLRHAAAMPGVKAVLTGTSNPVHLSENVAALAAPPGPEDLLT